MSDYQAAKTAALVAFCENAKAGQRIEISGKKALVRSKSVFDFEHVEITKTNIVKQNRKIKIACLSLP